MAKWPYTTQRWQRLRKQKLQANPLCEVCLKIGRLEVAVAVDHIIAIRAGGEAYPPLDGLMSCCASCHNRKTRGEQLGKELPVVWGCDERGYPLDPNHPWNKE
jgi:5-methylcytosine-specific restriction enzyme A